MCKLNCSAERHFLFFVSSVVLPLYQRSDLFKMNNEAAFFGTVLSDSTLRKNFGCLIGSLVFDVFEKSLIMCYMTH